MTDDDIKFHTALMNITSLVSFGCKEDFKKPIIEWLKVILEVYERKGKE